MEKEVKDMSVEEYWEYINQVFSDTFSIPSTPPIKKTEEKCKICNRNKDVGCKCWWCGN